MARTGEEIRQAAFRRRRREAAEQLREYSGIPAALYAYALGRVTAIVDSEHLNPAQQVDHIRAICEAVRLLAPLTEDGTG